jgi:hypothetical protein
LVIKVLHCASSSPGFDPAHRTSLTTPQRAQRSAQWYIAMAAAAPALSDRVEPC